MISWPGNADHRMLTMRPSPGRQSTVMTPLEIIQSVWPVLMVICAWAREGLCNSTSAIADSRSCFIGLASILQRSGGLAAGLVWQANVRMGSLVWSIEKLFQNYKLRD